MIIYASISSFISKITPPCISKICKRIRLTIAWIFHCYHMRKNPEIYNNPRYRNWVKLSEDALAQKPPEHDTQISVINQDSLVAAADLKRRERRVAVLNMACSAYFGGGYQSGAFTQEEEIARRTTLAVGFHWLLGTKIAERLYPIHKTPEGAPSKTAVLYNPTVRVLRDQQNKLLPPEEQFEIGVVSAAAFDFRGKPEAVAGMTEEQRAITTDKVTNLFKAAKQTDADTVVLGALGCGAFKNQPKEVADIFRRVIREFGGHFREIVFAIYDPGAQNPEGTTSNFETFKNAFILSSKAEGKVNSLIGAALATPEQRKEQLRIDLPRLSGTIFGKEVRTPEALTTEYEKNGVPPNLREKVDLVFQQGVGFLPFVLLTQKYDQDHLAVTDSPSGLHINFSHTETGYRCTVLKEFNLQAPPNEAVIKTMRTTTTIDFELQDDGTYKDYCTITEH